MSTSIYTDETPESVKNAKGLHLITQNTPNGQKIQILLEELREKYGLESTTTLIQVSTMEQKKDWFLRINSHGRIPVLIDNTRSPPFPVFESGAIMLYLAQNYDPDCAIRFSDELEQSQALQWLFFWHASGIPNMQQSVHFVRKAPENIPYAVNRFHEETIRNYGLLEDQLSGKSTGGEPRDYLAGNGKGRFSVADIGTWPWIKSSEWMGISNEEMANFPNLREWVRRIADKKTVQAGIGNAYQ